ncbi:hypothetical protein CC86DRAFT_372877 [Ophiobolus disseminans]|uniref:Calcineurin-like phosphoesterase domain-containing protein n=1 Tax=Ophiobolus disseminans TaxID=1469910 RepID=A0A6A6ZML3_9PLEO|nr:hypothetical protein CC86DRAFT_372877 [Ophiobolus disseminans]
MQPSRLLFALALLLAPVALLGTAWLYLYPIFHGCGFPAPPSRLGGTAPFRLLALGDPQLEGDSSLPDPNAPMLPSLQWFVQDMQHGPDTRTRIKTLRRAVDGLKQDVPRYLEGKRKAVDLWGNDLYLAHIVRSVRWWSEPSHVAVLGDLLGSQWITAGEFEKRARRYWGVVMKGFDGVPRAVYGMSEKEGESVDGMTGKEEEEHCVESEMGNLASALADAEQDDPHMKEDDEGEHPDGEVKEEEPAVEEQIEEEPVAKDPPEEQGKPLRKPYWGGTTEVLGAEKDWANRVINIAGNHDVGYAGDLDESRVERFEKAFGNVNWDIWFTLPPASNDTHTPDESDTDNTPPALRIVVLNSMNIDTPAWSSDLQTETYSFMNHIITTARPVQDKTHATILLTHIPLEKQAGICVDRPYFAFFDGGHGVREQNMLSDHSSKTILQGVFGMSENRWAAGEGFGRRGIVLNGHDHEGCDVVHFARQEGAEDACAVNDIQSEDAYWPKITTTMPGVEAPTGTMDALVTVETSSINETNPLLEHENTSPAKNSHPSPDPPSFDPEPEPAWLAHSYPPRPYHISHDAITNTSHCTSISSSPHIREITLRSMMGDFSGHAGFLSAWFDAQKGEKGEWIFEFNSCGVGVQHWWWGVHSVDFALVVVLVVCGVSRVLETYYRPGSDGKNDSAVKANGTSAEKAKGV